MRKPINKIHRLSPDLLFNNLIIAKIINGCMKDGKKSAAERQVYNALDLLKKETKTDDAIVTLEQALDNIKPKVEVRPRRIGGAVYQVPTPVRGNRQNSLAIRWLVTAARARTNKQFHSFAEKLAAEITAALKNEGSAVAKRMEVEKMADANKAFAHLRW